MQSNQTAASPMPPDGREEIVVAHAVDGDELLWVPQAEGIWFKPLCLCVTHGYYVNLLRVRRTGVLSRHRHSGPVHASVIKGSWYYLEHDWIAQPGSYVMEAPGETHTLMVPEGCLEMITHFHVTGGYVYLDADGKPTGLEDVFTKIERARSHYADVGLAPEVLNQLIR